jgi:hypothetical protein
MSQSGYIAWNVTAGEVPTTAMWNILGANDAAFNTGNGLNDAAIIGRHLASSAFLAIYPVGAIYISTAVVNPGTIFGGTWVAYGQGQVLAGYLSGDPNFGTPGGTGGATTHFHWQTIGSDAGTAYVEVDGAGSGQTRVITVNRVTFGTSGAAVTGAREDGTYTASSLQPYVTVYMWNRTA